MNFLDELETLSEMTKEEAEEYARKVSGFSKEDQEKSRALFAKKVNKTTSDSVKKDFKKAGIAAGAVLGTAVAGAVAAKAYKKYKAKKNVNKDEKLEEAVIDVMISKDGEFYLESLEMDFLLEAFDYELSESEILDLVLEASEVQDELPGNGVRYTTSSRELGKVSDRQYSDMKRPTKDQVNTGKGRVVNSVYVDDDLVDELSEEVCYEFDKGMMDLYMEATGYELSPLEICMLLDESGLLDEAAKKTTMDKLEDKYNKLKEKNPTLAGAVKGAAYAVGGAPGGYVIAKHKIRRAKREGKELTKKEKRKLLNKHTGKGLGYQFAASPGSAVGTGQMEF